MWPWWIIYCYLVTVTRFTVLIVSQSWVKHHRILINSVSAELWSQPRVRRSLLCVEGRTCRRSCRQAMSTPRQHAAPLLFSLSSSLILTNDFMNSCLSLHCFLNLCFRQHHRSAASRLLFCHLFIFRLFFSIHVCSVLFSFRTLIVSFSFLFVVLYKYYSFNIYF